jgi:hypothetical protein
MILGFSLGSYVKLVDYTGRLFREGKASISAELAEIFERLGRNAQANRTCNVSPAGKRAAHSDAGAFPRFVNPSSTWHRHEVGRSLPSACSLEGNTHALACRRQREPSPF